MQEPTPKAEERESLSPRPDLPIGTAARDNKMFKKHCTWKSMNIPGSTEGKFLSDSRRRQYALPKGSRVGSNK
jgi:hypothetical protein